MDASFLLQIVKTWEGIVGLSWKLFLGNCGLLSQCFGSIQGVFIKLRAIFWDKVDLGKRHFGIYFRIIDFFLVISSFI